MTTSASRRRERLGVLAHAKRQDIQRYWTGLGLDPEFNAVRGPETGLVMLRGRVGGGGTPFNVGEATITRASIKLASGATGHAAALGRDHAKVQLAAVIDAVCADETVAVRVDDQVIAPLKALQEQNDARMRAETAATKVDFFTMVRGDD